MPPLYNKLPDEEYSDEKSEVLRYLCPGNIQKAKKLMERARRIGAIKFFPKHGLWAGTGHVYQRINEIPSSGS